MKIQLRYPDDTPAGYVIYENGISKVFDEKGNELFEVEGIFPLVPRKMDYSWIEKVLEKGMKDCRKRFILYVASRYLVNVKGISEEEAIKQLKDFYYKNGNGKIYDSWLRSVVKGVKSKGLKPPTLEKLKERDKELYEEILRSLD